MSNWYKAIPFITTLVFISFFFYKYYTDGEVFFSSFIEHYQYLGVGILSFFSGFVLTLPIPASVWINTYLDAGLFYPLIILVIAIGVTLGDTVSVLFAHYLRDISKKRNPRVIQRLSSFRERWEKLPLVILLLHSSFAPISNEFLLYPLIFLGYKIKVLLAITFIGNFVFTIIVTQLAIAFI